MVCFLSLFSVLFFVDELRNDDPPPSPSTLFLDLNKTLLRLLPGLWGDQKIILLSYFFISRFQIIFFFFSLTKTKSQLWSICMKLLRLKDFLFVFELIYCCNLQLSDGKGQIEFGWVFLLFHEIER